MKKLKLILATIIPIILIVGLFQIYENTNLFAQKDNTNTKSQQSVDNKKTKNTTTNKAEVKSTSATSNTTSPNIRLNNLEPNQTIPRNFTITGEAVGTWLFEADFPVVVKTTAGDTIDSFIAQGQGDTMTEDFVSFEVTVDLFDFNGNRAVIEFQKDNPSGNPELDESISIPVNLGSTGKGGF